MKKLNFKKLMAIAVSLTICATCMVGCSIIEYDEDTDYGQVLIELKESSFTVDDPVMTDYLDPNGNPVKSVDQDPSSSTFGKTLETNVQCVKRDHDGNPIYKTKYNGSQYLYYLYNADGKEQEVTKDSATAEVCSDEYWINPEKVMENGIDYPEGNEYQYLGIAANGCAYWKSLHEYSGGANKYYYGKAKEKSAASETISTSADFRFFLPVVTYERDNGLTNYSFVKYFPVHETKTVETEADYFFKEEVMYQFAQNGKDYLSEGDVDIDDVFDRIIKDMYSELIYKLEIQKYVADGKIEWGVTEENTVNQSIYSSIDSALESIYEDLADKHDRSYITGSEAEESGETTYETKESSSTDPDYDKDYEVWHISQYPERLINNSTDNDRNSLERAALRELIQEIDDSIEDTNSMTAAQREKFTAEIEEMYNLAKDDSKITYLYTKLYTYDVIRFMYGDSVESNLKASYLQEIVGKVDEMSDEDALESYREELESQQSSYDDVSNYYTATSDGDTILYYASDDVFWVQHILLPFSDDETAALTEYKTNHTDEEIKAYRERLAAGMTVYKHVNGEDDTSNPLTLDEAYSNIKSAMNAAYGSEYASLNKFDDLIYDYNTDPGIFGNEMGYAVNFTSEEDGGQEETYMIEFATESRELLRAYKKGVSLKDYKYEREGNGKYSMTAFERKYIDKLTNTVKIGSISQPVITDYGVHILMLNVVPVQGQILLPTDYLTGARKTTVLDAVKEDETETASNNKISAWKNNVVNGYADSVVYDTVGNVNSDECLIAIYKNRFQATLDEYEDDFTAQIADEKEAEEEETEEEAEEVASQT